MKKLKTKICLFFLTPIFLNAQTVEKIKPNIVNPKGKWYFGANIGLNNIGQSTTFIVPETNYYKKRFQAGVFAEYYFAKQWSITNKISYFETGLDYYYYSPGTSSYFLGSPEKTYSANFSGQVLVTSLQTKWEFRFVKNFKGYLKFGIGYYFEMQSSYENYINDKYDGNYPSSYGSWLSGCGFTYFINDKYSLFIENEYHIGSVKYNSGNSWLGNGDRNASNQLINIGIKYNFKK